MIPYQSPQMVLHGDNPALIRPPCPHYYDLTPLSLGNTMLSPIHWDDTQNLLTIPETIKNMGYPKK
jgi:hypothetical protein